MKIAVAGDCHVNKSTYGHVKDKDNSNLPFRTVDHMKSMAFAVDEVVSLKPDLFVFVGDTYDNFYPSPDIGGFFSSQLRKLKENNIPVIILVGNHEVCKKHHALMPLKELDLDFVKVVDAPTMIKMNNYVLMLFPYSLAVEQDKISLHDQFDEFVKDVKQEVLDDPSMQDMPVIFFGHFGVRGASMNQWMDKPTGLITGQTIKRLSKKNFRNTEESAISVEDLDNIGASYVFLGDYHKHQVLPTKKCKAMYTGSIERTDINEMGQRKGFLLFDSEMPEDDKLGKCRFIEYKNCRPFVELRGTWNEIVDGAKLLATEYTGAIVKIKFMGDRNQLVECSSGLAALKERIKAKINPAHIMYEQEIVDTDEVKSATELEKTILEKGYVGTDDVLDIVDEIIGEKQIADEEKIAISEMAKEIYNEVRLSVKE